MSVVPGSSMPGALPAGRSSSARIVRISSLRWIAGTYYVILGASLLILTPAALDRINGYTWLRGAITAVSGLVLLWLAVVAARRTVVCGLQALVGLSQLAFGMGVLREGVYAAGATLVWFALGLLWAAAVRWRMGELPPLQAVPPEPRPSASSAGARFPDVAGIVLAGATVTQGLDFLFRPAAGAAVPPQLGAPTAAGLVFVAAGAGMALAQILPRLALGVRWAGHAVAGVVQLALWAGVSAFLDPPTWILGAAVAFRGVTSIGLPWISLWAEHLDRRSLYPRIALGFATATVGPLVIGATAIVGLGSATTVLPARQVAFGATIITAVLCSAAGVVLARRLTVPLEALVQGVARIAAGEREVQLLSAYNPTEVARLAHAVQAMAASLDARAAQQAVLAEEAAMARERSRLARDLHDSAQQTITAIGMSAYSGLKHWTARPEVAHSRLEQIGGLATRAQTELRALILALRPDQLEAEGLVKALRVQAAAWAERQEFAVDVALCGEPAVPLSVKEEFYRVALEAMHNAARHAHPTRLALSLTDGDGRLELVVQDDGAGFDPTLSYPGHLGLVSMRERAASIGAVLEIESIPGCSRIRLVCAHAL